MGRSRGGAAVLLAAMLVASSATATAAQDQTTTPEGVDWLLTRISVDGVMTPVPGDVQATLLLQDGVATGNAGCNRFSGAYDLSGSSITINENLARTSMLCQGDPQDVEDAYLAALPNAATWAIDAGSLQLMDADASPLLVYGGTVAAGSQTQMDTVLATLLQLQTLVTQLQARVSALEQTSGSSGGGTAKPQSKRPAAPKVRGKVQTIFPAWMRDQSLTEPPSSSNKNRELIKWQKVGSNVDGIRVYARRGYCALKSSADPTQALTPDDFRRKTGKAQLIAELDASAKRYKPRHDAIDRVLPAAPNSPYSADQYYDVLLATFNANGESKRVLAGSYYLQPEFNCP